MSARLVGLSVISKEGSGSTIIVEEGEKSHQVDLKSQPVTLITQNTAGRTLVFARKFAQNMGSASINTKEWIALIAGTVEGW